jgi:endonuclease
MIDSGVVKATLQYPEASELRAFLREHMYRSTCMIQVVSKCAINYSGRAASTAEAGDYLVMIKSDRSLQIHGSKGVKPVNWQPYTDSLLTSFEDGKVVLTAQRCNPGETVKVVFLEPAFAVALEFREASGFMLTGSEADMRAALRKNPSVIEPGLVVLDEELGVGVGGVDLYACDQQGRYVVVEVKRSKAAQEAVHQLHRYVTAIQSQVSAEVRGILAAPGITNPAMAQLNRLGLEFVQLTALPVEDDQDQQPSLFSL